KTHRDQEWTTASDQVSSEDSFVGFIPTRRHPTSGQFESIVLAAGPASLGPRIYAAPELVLGSPPSAASDQFSFCAALFHRLSRHPPAGGEPIAMWLRELLKGRVAQPPARPDVPASVQTALLRGLERDPAARFDRMATLVGKLSRHRPRVNGRRAIAVLAGAAVVVTGFLVITELRTRNAGARDLSSCDGALAEWDTLWNTNRQDELAKRGAAPGDTTPARRNRPAAGVGPWRSAPHTFCNLPAPGAESSECISRAHDAATDLLALVRGAPARLARAAAAAEALPTAEQCQS